MLPFQYIYIYTENGNFHFVFWKPKTETANFPLFAANGNKSLFSLVGNDKRQSTIAVSANVPIYVQYSKTYQL